LTTVLELRGIVHQHFMLIPVFTVTENVMLGEEVVVKGDFLDRDSAAHRITEISEQYGLEVDPRAFVRDLPVGVQQRVEIIKLLYRKADILILDEPTAVLTPQEVGELFTIMRSLVDQGKSIIFITHKLGEVVLKVEDLIVLDERRQVAVDGVSFEVREGEILGVAGVQGNGQTELVEAVTGLRRPFRGRIDIQGIDVIGASPRAITELGSAHVPEDRQRDGLVLPFPVSDNLVLNTYYRTPFSKGAVLDREEIRASAELLIGNFDIRTPSASTSVALLSGGNQQKVIVGREFSRPIKLLIASQPTRGLDVGSIEYIHGRILEKRSEGTAVMLVSPELDEIMDLSDRIAVMYRGKIIDIVEAKGATREKIGLLMAGITSKKQAAS
jgi:simple sugar transport system ATP-binding protein